jgi:uncharacterized cupredoxin-like copper-binding protein
MKTRALLLMPAVAAVVAAGGASASVHSAAKTLRVKAAPNGDLRFTKTKLAAPAGKVTIKMTNPKGSLADHGIAIEGNGVDKEGKIVSPGSKSSVSAQLKAGTYTFYCPAGAHRAAGMKGKLTVK